MLLVSRCSSQSRPGKRKGAVKQQKQQTQQQQTQQQILPVSRCRYCQCPGASEGPVPSGREGLSRAAKQQG
jgi:hypothetical protein